MATRNVLSVSLAFLAIMVGSYGRSRAQEPGRPRLTVSHTADFEVTGMGDNAAWSRAQWTTVPRRVPENHPYDTRIKVLYSDAGLYVLLEASDRSISATMTEDFMDLWNEDVFEVFLWTDERHPVYFEYEISPLNKELPIVVPNFGGQFFGWLPWHYDGERRTRKFTSVLRDAKGTIQGWGAEFFIPYALLKPLQNVPPQAGTRWRANFYRMDYDGGKRTTWQWSQTLKTFHEYEKFGELVFGSR